MIKLKIQKKIFLFIFDNCEDFIHISIILLNMPNNAFISGDHQFFLLINLI